MTAKIIPLPGALAPSAREQVLELDESVVAVANALGENLKSFVTGRVQRIFDLPDEKIIEDINPYAHGSERLVLIQGVRTFKGLQEEVLQKLRDHLHESLSIDFPEGGLPSWATAEEQEVGVHSLLLEIENRVASSNRRPILDFEDRLSNLIAKGARVGPAMFSPAQMLRAWHSSLTELGIALAVVRGLHAVFGHHVLGSVAQFYSRASAILIQHGMGVNTLRVRPTEPSEAVEPLSGTIGAPFESTYTDAHLQVDVEAAVQGDPGAAWVPITNLIAVSKLLEPMIDNKHFEMGPGQALKRLKWLIIKVALTDSRFITESKHPFRDRLHQLLSKCLLASAGERQRAALMTEINLMVESIEKTFQIPAERVRRMPAKDVAGADVDRFLAQMPSVANFETEAAYIVRVRQLCQSQMDLRLQVVKLAPHKSRAIVEIFSPLLTVAYLRSGQGGEWPDKMNLLERVIASMSPEHAQQDFTARQTEESRLMTQLGQELLAVGVAEKRREVLLAEILRGFMEASGFPEADEPVADSRGGMIEFTLKTGGLPIPEARPNRLRPAEAEKLRREQAAAKPSAPLVTPLAPPAPTSAPMVSAETQLYQAVLLVNTYYSMQDTEAGGKDVYLCLKSYNALRGQCVFENFDGSIRRSVSALRAVDMLVQGTMRASGMDTAYEDSLKTLRDMKRAQ